MAVFTIQNKRLTELKSNIMNMVGVTQETIKEAAALIRKGGLVAFPTETVYGLGADALNPLAVVRIFEVKNRPRFDPLIVHLADFSSTEKLCSSVDERARKLMEKFWPGPLTLVLPKTEVVPDIVTAGLPTVAIRMPAHPVALRLIEEAGTPIAAPSANPFGYLSPTTAEHVREQLGERVDLILEGGKCPIGVESTVIELTGKEPLLLRPGGLSIEEIEKVIGKVKISTISPRPRSPGQLTHHYSPRTPIRILKGKEFELITHAGAAPSNHENGDENGESIFYLKTKKRVGLLSFKSPKKNLPYEVVEILSPRGDLREAAANLFSCLHKLDRAGLDIILAEPVPEVGLGRAIMDRLCKAAGRDYSHRLKTGASTD
ncbi:MAG: Threonylcarbamoyl-AMP synthase [Actinobacteria bacterium]|nr:Threonylcarbamoyl-AMP synthase [Actinomycetota bacterium]